jgi:hypothetical protein
VGTEGFGELNGAGAVACGIGTAAPGGREQLTRWGTRCAEEEPAGMPGNGETEEEEDGARLFRHDAFYRRYFLRCGASLREGVQDSAESGWWHYRPFSTRTNAIPRSPTTFKLAALTLSSVSSGEWWYALPGP